MVVAQLVERLLLEPEICGSNPANYNFILCVEKTKIQNGPFFSHPISYRDNSDKGLPDQAY